MRRISVQSIACAPVDRGSEEVRRLPRLPELEEARTAANGTPRSHSLAPLRTGGTEARGS
jgi:hypothetical protein